MRVSGAGNYPALPKSWRSLAVLSLTGVACGPPSGETLYHVSSAGMALPVVERGSTDAPAAIVHLHGGPGDSRLDTRLGGEERLAESFLYVTWAQRTTPFATGALRRRTATLAQHVRDLEAVVATVQARHPGLPIVLTGFSWGGAMAIEYLAESPAPGVVGAVLLGALVDARTAIDDSWTMLRAHGEQRVLENAPNREYWADVIDLSFQYTAALSRLSPERYLSDFIRPRVRACAQMRDDLGLPDNVENERKGVYSRYHLLPPTEATILEWMVDEILDIDLRPRLHAIRRPVLVLWGELDCNTPVQTADILFEGISTPPSRKSRQVLSGIPHDVIDSAPDDYALAVSEFINDLL